MRCFQGESSFATAASKLNVSPAHKQAYIRIFVKAAQLKNWCTLFCDGERVINQGYHKAKTKNYYQPVIPEGTTYGLNHMV